jgi:hypothetical protein
MKNPPTGGPDIERKLSDPGPENRPLLRENPSRNAPPFTDRGDPGPLWYSFDLAPRRVQEGGWTIRSRSASSLPRGISPA